MTFFIYSALLNAFIAGLLGIVVILKNRRDLINKLFFGLSTSVVFWSLAYWQWMSSDNAISALLYVRLLAIGSLFIPIFYFHWIAAYIDVHKSLKKLIIISYFFAVFLSLFAFSKYFINGVESKYIFSFWPNAGILYTIYIIFIYFGLTIYSLILLFRAYKISSDFKKKNIKYIIFCVLIGFGGGATNFFLWYNIPIYPYGNFLVSFYPLILAIATLKYHLFNIRVIATELLTFTIWVFLFVRTLMASNWQNAIIDGGLLIAVIFFGILLIRSVLKEVQQREKIEELSKYKSELLSIVAHQIKNPLAVIKGYATLIKDKTVSEPNLVSEIIQKIHVSACRLIDLLNNLLDLGHIEDGKMHYDFEKIELNEFLKEIVDDFQFTARQKNLELVFKSAPQKVLIKGDSYKLSQVFRNLIDNAIKYTEKGFVKIAITRTDTDYKSVLITISDSGMGMSQESIGKLFQKFVRGAQEEITGSGLGLYIGKQIIEAHQGKIWAESEGENKGSRFYVELPML